MALWGAVIVTLIVLGVGGAGAYLVWLKTRPKKEVWKAKVYQLSEGVREPKKDSEGNVISDVRLQELKPYAKDVIEKINKEAGIIVYRLQKLNKPVPAVTSDVVDYWGDENKEVMVLMVGDTLTLLKKGYDKKVGEIIFQPMPHDRINMIKSEMAIRKDRLQKEKDILQAITPWIVAGILMLGLVSISYVIIDGYIEVAEKNEGMMTFSTQQMVKIEEMRQGRIQTDTNLGKQDDSNNEPPPLIEGG